MSEETIPTWKETRQKILNQGVDETSLDAKVEEYRKKMGQFVSTEDMLYYIIAQKEYRLSMPRVGGIERGRGGGGGSAIEVTASEINPDPGPEWVKLTVLVANKRNFMGKNGEGLICDLIDSTGSVLLKCFKPENVPSMDQALEEGKIYTIDGVGVFRREASNGFDASAVLTWHQKVRVEESKVTAEKFLKDLSAKNADAKENEGVLFKGFVTDDDLRTYEGCVVCRKGVSKTNGICERHKDADTTKYELYSAHITDGNTHVTADFGMRGPEDSILHSAVTVLGTYNAKRREVRVSTWRLNKESAIPSTKMVTAPETTRHAEDITPEQVLISLVKTYGLNPVAAVAHKLKTDCGLNDEQIDAFLEENIKNGVIQRDDEILRWVK